MSDVAQGPGDARAGTGAKRSGALGVLLGCFAGTKAAGKARCGLDAQLKAQGAALLDSVVVQVNAKHKASVYDPRRVVQGTLTAALTWGLFGLVADGLKSLAIWAILGAVCGGLWGLLHRALAQQRRTGPHRRPAPGQLIRAGYLRPKQ